MTDNSRYREFILTHPVMSVMSGGYKLAECVQPIIDAAIEQHLMTLEWAKIKLSIDSQESDWQYVAYMPFDEQGRIAVGYGEYITHDTVFEPIGQPISTYYTPPTEWRRTFDFSIDSDGLKLVIGNKGQDDEPA